MTLPPPKLLSVAALALGLLTVAVLRAGSALHYSTWGMDEHFVVPFAVGFLGFDLNPHWFGYHTLPMYIVSGLYAVIYAFYQIAGLVGTRVEFAALLFENDAVFYVSARLLVSLIHTLGAFVLAWIVHRHYRSTPGAALVFAAAILLQDSVLAANHIRVDTFVFLFLSLLILFSCYGAKTRRNLLFGILACAAAIASKVPALVLFPVLLLALVLDIRRGHHPKVYLAYAIVGVPLLALAFMPYAALDFETYRLSLGQLFSRASGSFKEKIGNVYHQGVLSKLINLVSMIAHQAGWLSVAGTMLTGIYGLVRRDPRLILAFLYTLAYTVAFATSASVDSYWLRPVYPLYLFLTVAVVVEVSRQERCAALLRDLEQRLGIGGRATDLAARAPLLLLAVYIAFLAQTGASGYYRHLTDTREDTRVLASRWISDELPEGSIVILDTFLAHYLPRVFSQDPNVTFASFDYPFARRNRLLIDAFEHYFETHRAAAKKLRVAPYYARELGFDPQKIRLPRDAYIVISSSTYARYYGEQALANDPALTRRARHYYDTIKRLEEVGAFSGRGPEITIYWIP